MGKRKHYMKVRGINDLGSSFIHPDFFQNRLTVRTVTIAAGVVMHLQVTAIRTLTYVYTKPAGFTV